jgi:hypothetical protein
MSRRAISGLLAWLLAAPSFGGPVEAVRLQAPSALVSAPAAAVIAAPSFSATLSPAPLAAPVLAIAASASARLPAPVLEAQALPAAEPAALVAVSAAAPDARGPPRSAAGVSARVADTTRSWGVPVEQVLENRDVLLIGEDHGSLSTIETLAREMPRLAKAGVTAVGIEGLKAPSQDAVDDYVLRRTDALPRAALSFSPSRAPVFEALLTAARDNGVRVVALGLPLNEWASQVSRLAAQKTGDPAETFGTDFKDQVDRAERSYEYGFNEALAEVLLTRRNESMARFFARALGQNGKGVIVAGQAHVPGPDEITASRFHVRGDYGDLARELGTLALKAYSLTFTGGLFVSADAARDAREVRPEANKAAEEASPRGAPAFISLGPDRGLWHAGGSAVPAAAR